MKRRCTLRKNYDIDDLVILMIGDIEVDLKPYRTSEKLREKLKYWLGRAFDAGWIAAGEAVKLDGDED